MLLPKKVSHYLYYLKYYIYILIYMLYNVVDNVDAWFYEIYNVLNIIVDQPESITQYKKLRDMPHLSSYKIRKKY